jgi:methylated-DNA-[protein]-cysteine S-methyltransferase
MIYTCQYQAPMGLIIACATDDVGEGSVPEGGARALDEGATPGGAAAATTPTPEGAAAPAPTPEGGAVTGLWFADQKYFPQDVVAWEPAPDFPALKRLRAWLDAYFAGERAPIDFALRTDGSAFRQAVWRILREIPYGATITYGSIARRIAAEQGRRIVAAQAVGGAVGHNPISIVIPCHRVLGADGSLTGYGGGLDKKIALLKLEGILP